MEAEYHGQDKQAAMNRAQKGGGMVIWSTAPATKNARTAEEWGYWSDGADALIRSWESVVMDFSEGGGA